MPEYSRVTINGVEITGDPQPSTREAAELRHPSIVIEEEAARRITQIVMDGWSTHSDPAADFAAAVAEWTSSSLQRDIRRAEMWRLSAMRSRARAPISLPMHVLTAEAQAILRRAEKRSVSS